MSVKTVLCVCVFKISALSGTISYMHQGIKSSVWQRSTLEFANKEDILHLQGVFKFNQANFQEISRRFQEGF